MTIEEEIAKYLAELKSIKLSLKMVKLMR